MLSNTQSRCSRATAANKVNYIVFKRASDNLCFLSGAAADWNSLPNNATACTVFKSFLNSVKLYIKTNMSH